MSVRYKFFIYGFIFGLCFPVGAVLIDGFYTYGEFSFSKIGFYFSNNLLHYIISSAPIILGMAFYFIGVNVHKHQIETKKAKQANKHLQQTNDELDSFNYHVSHDLQTVLHNIDSLSRMLEKYISPFREDKVRDLLDRLQRVSKNGNETVASFLKFADSNTIIFEENQEEIQIATGIDELLSVHELTEKIEINYLKKDFDSLMINPKIFESVFLNLITNAIKYSDDFPKVNIALTRTKQMNVVAFTDHGIGIDLKKNEDKLFAPFKRIKNKKKVQSNGVGLYLVKKIITSIGGSITVESELDIGTTFFIHFPQNQQPY